MTAPARQDPLPPHRVIFVNRVYWPSEAATAQLLTDLAETLAARGWRAEVVTAGDHDARGAARSGVQVHRTGPGAQVGGLATRVLAYWRFLAAARRRLGDLLAPGDLVVPMTDPPLLATAADAVARRRGARVVNWIQDIYPEIVPAHAGRAAGLPLLPLRWLRNRSWRRAAANVVVGADMAPLLQANGIAAGAITCIPNWAPRELDEVPAAAAVTDRRRAWRVDDRFVIAYSGNLGRVHEFDTVLGAAAALRADARFQFLFIGDGPRSHLVRRQAAQRGLTNVRFLPPQPRSELAVSLAAADVHLVTLREGFQPLVSPSKLAGVLAAGRPVAFVGPTDSALARSIVAHDCGLVVAPGAALALADGLRELATVAGRHAGWARAARAWYLGEYTLATAATHWERVLAAAGGAPVRVATPGLPAQTLPGT